MEKENVHAPAADDEGCLSCHGAHATHHPELLRVSVSDTCLNCHDGESATFAEKHLGFAPATMDCGECHDPHASRMAGMLLPETHEPFASGDCTACHKEPRETPGGAR